MKRILAFLLAALLLTGCGTANNPNETTRETSESPATDGPTSNNPESNDVILPPFAAKSPNFGINRAMMDYFFHITYDQYASMAIYYGLDTKTSFKKQSCLLTDGGSWFDFFMQETVLYVSDLLSLCETAKERGLILDTADHETVDAQINQLKAEAKAYGCNLPQLLYILFNCDLTEKEYRTCLELTLLADKASSDFPNSFDHLTVEDYEAYYTEHTKEFIAIDILSFSVSAEHFSALDETSSAEEVNRWLDRLMQAENGDAYAAIAEEYMRTVLAMTDDDVAMMLDDLLVSGVRLYNISDQALSEWMFNASKGDSKAYTFDGSTYDVLYAATDPYRNESATRHLRHILFSADSYAAEEEAKAAAEKAYTEWEASGFDTETFSKLYKQFSDTASPANEGGLHENVVKGVWVEEIDEWLFDSTRKIGDHALIETAYGWHIVDYAGDSPLNAWQAEVRSAMLTEAYNELLTRYEEVIEFNEEVLSEIDA